MRPTIGKQAFAMVWSLFVAGEMLRGDTREGPTDL